MTRITYRQQECLRMQYGNNKSDDEETSPRARPVETPRDVKSVWDKLCDTEQELKKAKATISEMVDLQKIGGVKIRSATDEDRYWFVIRRGGTGGGGGGHICRTKLDAEQRLIKLQFGAIARGESVKYCIAEVIAVAE